MDFQLTNLSFPFGKPCFLVDKPGFLVDNPCFFSNYRAFSLPYTRAIYWLWTVGKPITAEKRKTQPTIYNSFSRKKGTFLAVAAELWKKVGRLLIQCLPSGPSGDRGENFEVGVEHILDRCNAHTAYNTQEVPFPAIWRVCKAKNFLARSAPADGGAPLR